MLFIKIYDPIIIISNLKKNSFEVVMNL